MEKDDLAKNLKWFHILELTQVGSYLAQSRAAEDTYLCRVLQHTASIEKQHAEDIERCLVDLGHRPGGMLSRLAPAAGSLLGSFLSRLGVARMLRANVMIEEKAKKDYNSLIQRLGDAHPEIEDLLWANLVDEDLHIAWFSVREQQLEE